jgi:regulator of sigma E protease
MGEHISIGRDLSSWFVLHDLPEGKEVSMTYMRNGEKKEIRFVPAVNVRYMLGMTYNLDDETAVIQSVSEGSPLYNAGVRSGDVIISINDSGITTARSMNEYFSANPMDGSEVRLVCERDGTTFAASLVPYESRTVDLGFSYNLGRVNTTPIGVLKYSLIEMRYWIVTTVQSLGQLFTGRFTVNDLSGPVGVVDIVGETYEEVKSEGALMTWMNMLNMIVLLSANLGVMNLLPIPAVDGGRLLFLAIEAIRRKPMNKKLEGTIQMVTVMLLLFLMVYVMYHDLVKLFAH